MRLKKHVPAWKKAGNTDHWTEILFRALTNRVAKRWRFVSFRGIHGGEWCGIVDVLAVRKDTSRSNHRLLKSGDLFEVILVQMKGGSAEWPSDKDIRRLKAVSKRYGAKAVVLFTWDRNTGERGKHCQYYRLGGRGWAECTATDIFGDTQERPN